MCPKKRGAECVESIYAARVMIWSIVEAKNMEIKKDAGVSRGRGGSRAVWYYIAGVQK